MTITYEDSKTLRGIWYPCYYYKKHINSDREIKEVIFCKTRRSFAIWIENKTAQIHGFAANWGFLPLEFDTETPLTVTEIYQMNSVSQKPTEIDWKETIIN